MRESRGVKAMRLVREGISVKEAAKQAGVSEFWLGLKQRRKSI